MLRLNLIHILKKTSKIIGIILISIIILILVILLFFRAWAAIRETKTATELAPPNGTFVQAKDLNLFIQDKGDKNAHPVFLIHGTGAWGESWRSTIDTLSQNNFRVIAIDLPPFGFSERPENGSYSRAEQAERLVALIDSLGLEKVTLVGHSFGAGPTVEAALLAPEKVSSLILIDAAIDVDPKIHVTNEDNVAANIFFASGIFRDSVIASTVTNPLFTKKFLEMFIYDPADATTDKVAIYQIPLQLKNTTKDFSKWLKIFIGNDTTSRSTDINEYQNLIMPTLILWGDKDSITPLERGVKLQKLIPNAKLEVLKDVGHIPQIENEEEVNEKLIEFLKGIK